MEEQHRKELYGDMTKEEIDLVYHHEGNYKGWQCDFTGCGSVRMVKDGHSLYALRPLSVRNWVPECWKELKGKIDKEVKE